MDANGNLITGDSFYREYNELNQLIRIRQGNTSSGAILEEFIWHPIEERVLVKDVFSNGVLNYSIYYVNKNYVHIENSSGNYTEKYIYQEGNLVAQVTTDGQKQFIHNDHLSSVTLITNASGNVVENSFHSPFGEIIEGGKASRFDYTGKEFNSVTQDYDYNARRYNPNWGKFLQPDNNIPATYDPQSLNRYSYGMNNPYKFIDPNGREPVRSQAGSADQVIKYIKDVEKNNPDLSPNQVLKEAYTEYRHYEKSDISDQKSEKYSPNFVYTENQGVVDIRHFFGNAYYTQKTASESLTHAMFNAWEISQFVLAPWSFFTYEDLTSNRLGREFGLNFDPDKPLSEQLEEFFNKQKTGKFPKWLWDIMPEEEGWFYAFGKLKFTEEGKGLPSSGGGGSSGGGSYGCSWWEECIVKYDSLG